MIRKALRTAQNYAPGLREAKNVAYMLARRAGGLLHDRDFSMIGRLPVRDDDLFLDVGGNRGQSILSMRRMRPDAPIVSFEPDPAMFAWLKRWFGSDPTIRLVNAGLGERDAARTLHTPRYRGFAYDGLATFSRQTATQYLSPKTVFGFDPARLEVDERTCVTRRLDDFDLKPTFIKIDVEGCEHEVLRGAVRTLSEHRPVLLIERYYENPAVPELLAALDYVEVRPAGRSFEIGSTTRENMICMTPDTLAAIQAARNGRPQ